jgi:hypothetical protein
MVMVRVTKPVSVTVKGTLKYEKRNPITKRAS